MSEVKGGNATVGLVQQQIRGHLKNETGMRAGLLSMKYNKEYRREGKQGDRLGGSDRIF